MGRDPIRLEPFLTRDYVDRQQKLAGLCDIDRHVSKIDIAAWWVLLAGLLIWIVMVW